MDGGVAIDTGSKGGKGMKGPSVETVPRKSLADITNLTQQNQAGKSQCLSLSTKQYVDKLHQENIALVKLLEDRNKIIQLSAIELQKLRINYQKVQQQNVQLAQANSQMLGELNSGKDKLKALRHELGCKNGLLKARQLESMVRTDDAGKLFEADKVDGKVGDKKRSRRSKTQCLYPTTDEQFQAKDGLVENSLYSRRQSARLSSGEQGTTEDLIKIADALGSATVKPVQAEKMVSKKRLLPARRSTRSKPQEQLQELSDDSLQIQENELPVSPVHMVVMNESCTPSISHVQNETKITSDAPDSEDLECRRSSVRPLRRAAEKIQSYKEIPLNVKMRRTE
ncbi:hypothetical protein K2173_020542 [Erythroxylum novogranatense]|uniref:Shugoshin C-terminal domain-containing protein n=1 Tax=Erythroxylum novogranatense TaxID=1862640 RepID=A0AAV8TGT2_9ROSI|nr:hypothetical protein K2173_020542 [Erythroxylum novogranatense]